VVIAGDLTQRAKVGEYQEARALLERFSPLPVGTSTPSHASQR